MKGRSKRASGGVNEMAQDMGKKNMRYTYQSNVNDEAEERKRGGKAVGKVKGMKGKADMGRKPRKSGGRTGSNMSPLSSAAKGTPAPGRNVSGSLD
ncbi:MAG: hypothetical protein AMJ56_00340 [Anaerolineae bacterium SG8_19]|nr:MAG: hypothetical protein AMJ56_00340 [Anaerolineae bacterium SG8_19]